MFRWTDYLNAAKLLAAMEGEEFLRSAISRAYYAAFHVGSTFWREHAGSSSGYDAAESSEHLQVINALKSHSNRRVRNAGILLNSLRLWRNAADYELPFGQDVQATTKQAVLCAEAVIDALNQAKLVS